MRNNIISEAKFNKIVDRKINEGLKNWAVEKLGGMPEEDKGQNEIAIKTVVDRMKDIINMLYNFSDSVNTNQGGMVSSKQINGLVHGITTELKNDISILLDQGLKNDTRPYYQAKNAYDMNSRFNH